MSDLRPASTLVRRARTPGAADRSEDWPAPAARRAEEVRAADPRDFPAAAAFCVARAREGAAADPRPFVFVWPRVWERERGRPFFQGLAPERRVIHVRAPDEAEALWAAEEALKSGAASAVLALAEDPPFVASRRIALAAEAGGARAWLMAARESGALSAAHLRWRVESLPSAADPLDARAPGPARLRAELVRRRDGAPGVFELEIDDETGRLRLAAGLADRAPGPSPQGDVAAGRRVA